MVVSLYFIVFIIYSFLGWIWECTYSSLKTGRWDNRGFLHGPVCPIYGVGAILASLCFGSFRLLGDANTPLWKVFVICSVGSAVLEYVTSYVLEKKFHALWWDYHHAPLNINGRICLPATLCFGAVGVLLVRFAVPFSESLLPHFPPLVAEALSLVLAAILSADLVLTIQSLTDLAAKLDAAENEFNTVMQEGYQRVGEGKDFLSANVQHARLRARAAASALSERQQYVLRSIKRFSNKRANAVAAWLRDAWRDNGRDIPAEETQEDSDA